MADKHHISRAIIRYRLKKHPIASGFFAIFGLSSYKLRTASNHGLTEDFDHISRDFNRVFMKESSTIDE